MVLDYFVSDWTCDVCGWVLSSGNHYRSHMVKMHGVKLLACDKCSYKFLTQDELDDHMTKKHKNVTGVCVCASAKQMLGRIIVEMLLNALIYQQV